MVNAAIAGVDEKTFRKRCWCLVNLIADLSMVCTAAHLLSLRILTLKIRRERRLDGSRSVFKASVDGTDFRIREPTHFNSKWYSHKFKGPGLCYEVGLSIRGGEVIWAHGPFPCESYSDPRIFRMGMKKALLGNEKVVADGGYQDSPCSYSLSTDGVIEFPYVRARQEALNKRLKQFMVLGTRFRHNLQLHGSCFYAVLNLVQLSIEYGEPVFHVYYD